VPVYLRVKDRAFRRKAQGQRVHVQGARSERCNSRVKNRAFVAGIRDRDLICDGQEQRVYIQGSMTER